jgi:hypothetical protein
VFVHVTGCGHVVLSKLYSPPEQSGNNFLLN